MRRENQKSGLLLVMDRNEARPQNLQESYLGCIKLGEYGLPYHVTFICAMRAVLCWTNKNEHRISTSVSGHVYPSCSGSSRSRRQQRQQT